MIKETSRLSRAGRARLRRIHRPTLYLCLTALGFGAALLIAMCWRPGVF